MGQRVCKRDSLFIERVTSTADESSQGKKHASEYAVCRYHSLPGRGRVARAPSGARASDMTDKPQLKSKAKVQRSNGRIENSPKVPLPSGNGPLSKGRCLDLARHTQAPAGILTALASGR